MTNLEIRIQHAYLLDPYFQEIFDCRQEKQLIDKGLVYNSRESILQKIAEYEAAWYDRKQVLQFMQEVLKLDFYKSVIDVYIVGAMRGAISTPVLIGSNVSVENFPDILIHELLHNLISDNKQKIDVIKILATLFPDETRLTKNHVLIYAMMTKIYTEFLQNPTKLEDIKKRDQNFPDYVKAWEIVKAEGSAAIIEKFKSFYC